MKQTVKRVLIATLLISFVSLPVRVDAQITFVKDDKGQVTHLLLHQNKVDQPAKKIK